MSGQYKQSYFKNGIADHFEMDRMGWEFGVTKGTLSTRRVTHAHAIHLM